MDRADHNQVQVFLLYVEPRQWTAWNIGVFKGVSRTKFLNQISWQIRISFNYQPVTYFFFLLHLRTFRSSSREVVECFLFRGKLFLSNRLGYILPRRRSNASSNAVITCHSWGDSVGARKHFSDGREDGLPSDLCQSVRGYRCDKIPTAQSIVMWKSVTQGTRREGK